MIFIDQDGKEDEDKDDEEKEDEGRRTAISEA